MYYTLNAYELGNVSPELEQKTGLFEKMKGASFLLWAENNEDFDVRLEKAINIANIPTDDPFENNVEVSYYGLIEMLDDTSVPLVDSNFICNVNFNKFVDAIEKLFDKNNH